MKAGNIIRGLCVMMVAFLCLYQVDISYCEDERGDTLSVTSMSSEHLSEIHIRFSLPLDQKTSEKISHYGVIDRSNGKKIDIEEVSPIGEEDDEVVVCFAPLKRGTEVTVIIADVWDRSLQHTFDASYKEEMIVKINDNDKPKIIDFKGVGDRLLEVNFSEPVDFDKISKNDFVIDNGKYEVQSLISFNHNKSLYIQTKEMLDSGQIELQVSSYVKDYYGNGLDNPNIKTLYLVDSEPATIIGYKNDYPNRITLIFDKPIFIEKSLKSYYGHTNETGHISRGIRDSDLSDDLKELTLPFEETPLPFGYGNFYIKKGAIQDYSGNIDKTLYYSMQFQSDIEGPVLEKIKLIDDQMVLQYNEAVNIEVAEDKLNYQIYDLINDQFVKVRKIEASNNKVVLYLDMEKIISYRIKILQQEDLYGNVAPVYDSQKAIELSNKEEKTLDVLSFEQKSKSDSRVLTIDFQRKMLKDGQYSPLDLSVYELNGKLLSEYKDSDAIYTTMNAQKTEVLMALPKSVLDEAGIKETQIIKMSLKKVKDDNGKIVSIDKQWMGFPLQQNVNILSAEAMDRDKIRVVFDDELIFYDSDFIIVNAISGEEIPMEKRHLYLNDQGHTEIVYYSKASLDNQGLLKGEGLIYKVVGHQSKNAFGISLHEQQISISDKIPPFVESHEYTNGTIVLNTSEYVWAKSENNASENLRLQLDGEPLYLGQDYQIVLPAYPSEKIEVEKGSIKILLSSEKMRTKGRLVIAYNASIHGIIDNSNNNLCEFDNITIYLD